MKIKTKITQQDFIKVSFGMIAAPIAIFMIIYGVLFFVLYYKINMQSRQPNNLHVVILAFGLVLDLLVPVGIYRNLKKRYKANLRLQEDIAYEFTPDKMTMTGTTFQLETGWSTIYQIKETKDWFLIYNTPRMANLIPKKNLSSNELDDLRALFRSLDAVKIRKIK